MNEINCNEYGHIEGGKIQLEVSVQGDAMLYKNIDAFQLKKGICYAVAELHLPNEITTYTYDDFLKEAEGNEEIAKNCFEMTGDMNIYPDYYFEIGIESGWFVQCKCMYMFDHNKNDKCPKCGGHELISGDWNNLIEDEE